VGCGENLKKVAKTVNQVAKKKFIIPYPFLKTSEIEEFEEQVEAGRAGEGNGGTFCAWCYVKWYVTC
jgi:hypothetical protein